MFVLTVDLRLHPGTAPEVLPHLLRNARSALADEPGCRRFDVCTDPEDPDRLFLYEVYDDEAAFRHHQTTPHFKTAGAAIAEHVAERTRRVLTLVA